MRTMRIVHLSIIFILLLHTMGQMFVEAQESWFDRMDLDDTTAPFNNLLIYKAFTKPTTNPSLTQLTCFIKAANDLFQFIQKETVYIAQFELTVLIQNSKEVTVASKITKKEIRTADFTDTNSRDLFSNIQFDFLLTPGEYTLYIEITDFETRNPFRHQENIILPDYYSKPLSVTDILFCRAV